MDIESPFTGVTFGDSLLSSFAYDVLRAEVLQVKKALEEVRENVEEHVGESSGVKESEDAVAARGEEKEVEKGLDVVSPRESPAQGTLASVDVDIEMAASPNLFADDADVVDARAK